MELTGIFVYPIKAMGGIALNSAILEERGIRLDRRWMLIDDQNRFICQRQIEGLSLYNTEILDQHLKVQINEEHIMIPYDEKAYPEIASVIVWDDEIKEVSIASEEINNWFSKQLGRTCRLAFQGLRGIRKNP